jgi:hypothetical protein
LHCHANGCNVHVLHPLFLCGSAMWCCCELRTTNAAKTTLAFPTHISDSLYTRTSAGTREIYHNCRALFQQFQSPPSPPPALPPPSPCASCPIALTHVRACPRSLLPCSPQGLCNLSTLALIQIQSVTMPFAATEQIMARSHLYHGP